MTTKDATKRKPATLTVLTPKGRKWRVPRPRPIRVKDLAADPGAFMRHMQALQVITLEAPHLAHAILRQTERTAARIRAWQDDGNHGTRKKSI